MDMQELFKKLRKYEVKIRKAVNSNQQGDFKSVFKGTGLEFDDVRQYQYGDDIRTIDWNVSAKGQGTYVKTFKEERDQSVFFLVDVSASQEIGRDKAQKIDLAKEVSGVLILAASNLGSQVGMMCYSDVREFFMKPGKGPSNAHNLITQLFRLEPKQKKTNLKKFVGEVLGRIKRKSVIVLVSDFLDNGYENELKVLANRHDVIVVHVYDALELEMPGLGIVPTVDAESGKSRWLNTSRIGFGKSTAKQLDENVKSLQVLCKKHQIDYIKLKTGEDYVNSLINLFKRRNNTWKRG